MSRFGSRRIPALMRRPSGVVRGVQIVTLEDSSDVNAFYTNQGAGLVVTDDVDGLADEVDDTSSSFVLEARATVTDAGALTEGALVTWQVKVKQDADTTRFPIFVFQHVSGTATSSSLCLNTSTGAIDTDGTWATATAADDGAGYWALTMARTTAAGNTQIRLRVGPAANSTLDAATSSATVTGSVIVKDTLVTYQPA